MRSAALIRCSYSSPCALNQAKSSGSRCSVTSTGGCALRQVARSKKDADSGGISDVSIFSSGKASICSQLVFEEFFILVSLIAQRLSERNNANGVFAALRV